MMENMIYEFKKAVPEYAAAILWAWKPDKKDFAEQDDILEGYVVVKLDGGFPSGLMVFAKCGGAWEANPWSSRPVIKRLLGLCGGAAYTKQKHGHGTLITKGE